MLTRDQAKRLSFNRAIVAETRTFGPSEDLALRYAQTGLPFSSEHATYLTVYLASPDALELKTLCGLAAELERQAADEDYQWVSVVNVAIPLWVRWHRAAGTPVDPDLLAGHPALAALLEQAHPPFASTGGDLFFHIKAIRKETAEEMARWVVGRLGAACDTARTGWTVGDSLHNGRVYGGRMLHGLIGSVDPVCFSARAIIGDELDPHKGGCFGLTQRFIHDWQQLSGMADMDLENLIGRDHTGRILTNDDERCHIKCARAVDESGLNYRMVGESQPFRSSQSPYGKEDGIYQVAYAKSLTAFLKVLEGLLGNRAGYIKSRNLNLSHADQGNCWYVPSAKELGLLTPHATLTVGMNSFFDARSSNGRLFYNSKDYLHQLGNRTAKAATLDPLPTDRIVELLGYMFSLWHDTWYRRRPALELGHLDARVSESERFILSRSVAERKGYATFKTLQLLSAEPLGTQFGVLRIHPRELIVGVVPEYTLGSGFEVMRYLNAEEQDRAFALCLNEAGAAGHNIPDYQRVLETGLGGLLKQARAHAAGAPEEEARAFYQSVVYALEGVQCYLRNYAELARRILAGLRFGSQQDRKNLAEIADRLDRLSEAPPASFIDAVQLVFSLHCCLHLTGESVSIGRLDQLLAPFYARGGTSETDAQEIMDAFWIKMDEQVLLNHRHFNDRLSRGSGAITYAGGDFPQGAALNQWVQQITVGGSKPTDSPDAEDGCNPVTLMCLRSARRLPLNAPCLSLRLGQKTPAAPDVLREAVGALLAGGAHPFLINEDKIIAGLLQSAEQSEAHLSLADARDMACDGCFESMVAGKSEFAFSFVPVPEAIEMALNRGRTYAAAGPVHLSGLKASYRSEAPEDIRTFEQFYAIFLRHYRYKLVDFYTGMFSRYGNLRLVCPSPLLSCFIDGCLTQGRDLTAGGARYKLLAPLMNGIATAIDSLWAIRDMVFSDQAVFTLPELATALICDWGHDLKEPFCTSPPDSDRGAVLAERFKKLRAYALSRPKFGHGHKAVDAFARRLLRDLVALAYDVYRSSEGPVAEGLAALRKRFGSQSHPFEFIITPGIATFEDYGGIGSFLGASADGRRCGQPVASDFSPAPVPLDLPAPAAGVPWSSLHSWVAGPPEDGPAPIDPIGVGLSNGAPVDINIREGFPETELMALLQAFGKGTAGPNMLSISCADPETLAAAQEMPERFDLVRLRMGGWSEFFVAMFPQHQEHHRRRLVFEAVPLKRADHATPWGTISPFGQPARTTTPERTPP